MTILQLKNPFDAPIFRVMETDSTQVDARRLAADGAATGTTVVADRQTAGRGRVAGRTWTADAGSSLLFTILLRYGRPENLPTALSLRAGLAVALALEALPTTTGESGLTPTLAGRVLIKWPNDVLIASAPETAARKVCGILAESDGKTVYLGIGVNVNQSAFLPDLERKAISLRMALGRGASDRDALLIAILDRLRWALGADGESVWREEIERRLFRLREEVVFADGAADSSKIIRGYLEGLGPNGELLIQPNGAAAPRAFVTGEMVMEEL